MAEDTALRYKAYGFQVITIDGYDFYEIEKAFSLARSEAERPTLIIAKTVIGRYAPTMQGKVSVTGNILAPMR